MKKLLNRLFSRMVITCLLVAAQLIFFMVEVLKLQQYYVLVAAILHLLIYIAVMHLLLKDVNPSIKLAWIVPILMFPVLGGLLYLLYGHIIMPKKLEKYMKHAAEWDYETDLYANMAYFSDVIKGQPPYRLFKYTEDYAGSLVYQNTDVRYYPMGEDVWPDLVDDLKSAKKYIFLEYFIIEEGDVWGRILKILEERVRAGVEVRVLYDGTCTFYRLPYGYPKRMEALGIRCKMFAPLRPLVSTYYNNRDHRKIAVIDGRVGFTGGVNLADEYANLVSVYGVWKDTAVRLEGEAVRSLTLMFLQMWGMDEREPDTDSYGRYLNVPLRPLPGAGGYVLPYADSPLDDERVGECVYLDILNHAERYVRIFTPYLILDETMGMALTFAAKRGVDVELILPHVPDKKFAFALAKGHYRELLDAGVKIYEYTPGFVHAKVFVSDDRKAVVGTINLDYRSLYLHFEDAVYLYDCPCIKDIVADFDATRAQSQIVTHGDLARIPLHTRIAAALLKLVAPLM